MTKQEVIDLMESSQSAREWDNNCDKVKEAHDGQYPDYWWDEMKLSGRMDHILGRFGESSELKLYTFTHL